MTCRECNKPTDGRMYCSKRCMCKASDRRVAQRKIDRENNRRLEEKLKFEDVPYLR